MSIEATTTIIGSEDIGRLSGLLGKETVGHAISNRLASSLDAAFPTDRPKINPTTEMKAFLEVLPPDKRDKIKQLLKDTQGNLLQAVAEVLFDGESQDQIKNRFIALVQKAIVEIEQKRGVSFEEILPEQIGAWISRNYKIIDPAGASVSIVRELLKIAQQPEAGQVAVFDQAFTDAYQVAWQSSGGQTREKQPDDTSHSQLSFEYLCEIPEGSSLNQRLTEILNPNGGIYWKSNIGASEIFRWWMQASGVFGQETPSEELLSYATLAVMDPIKGINSFENRLFNQNYTPLESSILAICPEKFKPLLELFVRNQLEQLEQAMAEIKQQQDPSLIIGNYLKLLTFGLDRIGADFAPTFFERAVGLARGDGPIKANIFEQWNHVSIDVSFIGEKMAGEGVEMGFPTIFPLPHSEKHNSHYTLDIGVTLENTPVMTNPAVFDQFLDSFASTCVAENPQTQLRFVQEINSLYHYRQLPSACHQKAVIAVAQALSRLPSDQYFTAGEFAREERDIFNSTPLNYESWVEIHPEDERRKSYDDKKRLRFKTPKIIHDLNLYVASLERAKRVEAEIKQGGDRQIQLQAQLATLEQDAVFDLWRQEKRKQFETLIASLSTLPAIANPEPYFGKTNYGKDYGADEEDYRKPQYRHLLAQYATSKFGLPHNESITFFDTPNHILALAEHCPRHEVLKLMDYFRQVVTPDMVSKLRISNDETSSPYGPFHLLVNYRHMEYDFSKKIPAERKSEIVTQLTLWQQLIEKSTNNSVFLMLVAQADPHNSLVSEEHGKQLCKEFLDYISVLKEILTIPKGKEIPIEIRQKLDQFNRIAPIFDVVLDLARLGHIQVDYADRMTTGEQFVAKDVFDPYLLDQSGAYPYNHEGPINTTGLSSVSLTLDRGHIYIITGMTGSGKSSLLRALIFALGQDLIPPLLGQVTRFRSEERWLAQDTALLVADDEIPPNHSLFSAGAEKMAEAQGAKHLFADEMSPGAPAEFALPLAAAVACRTAMSGGSVVMCDHKGLDLFSLYAILGISDRVSPHYINPVTHSLEDGISGSYGFNTLRNKGVPDWFADMCQEILEADIVGVPDGQLTISSKAESSKETLTGWADNETLKSAGFECSDADGGAIGYIAQLAGASSLGRIVAQEFNTYVTSGKSCKNQIDFWETIPKDQHRRLIKTLGGYSAVMQDEIDTQTTHLLISKDIADNTYLTNPDRSEALLGGFLAYHKLTRNMDFLTSVSITEMPGITPEEAAVLKQLQEHHSAQPKIEPDVTQLRQLWGSGIFNSAKEYGYYRLRAMLPKYNGDEFYKVQEILKTDKPEDAQLIELQNLLIKLVILNETSIKKSGSEANGVISFVIAGNLRQYQEYLKHNEDGEAVADTWNKATKIFKSIVERNALPATFAYVTRSDSDATIPTCQPEIGTTNQMLAPAQAVDAINLAIQARLAKSGKKCTPRNLFCDADGQFLSSNNFGFKETPTVTQLTGVNKGGKTTDAQTILQLELVRAVTGRVFASKARMLEQPSRIIAAIGDTDGGALDSSFNKVGVKIKRVVDQLVEGALVILDEIGRGTDTPETESIISSFGEAAQQLGVKMIMVNHEKGEPGWNRIAPGKQHVDYLNVAYPITDNPADQFKQPPVYGKRGGAESFAIALREGNDPGNIELAKFFRTTMQEFAQHKKRVL